MLNQGWTFLKSPADKKHRLPIGLCKKVFIKIPITFLDWDNKNKLALTFMKKTVKVYEKAFNV